MVDETIDRLVSHLVTAQQLDEVGINLNEFGIKPEIRRIKCVYLSQEGIAVEMKDGTYLTAVDLKKCVESETLLLEYESERRRRPKFQYDGVTGHCYELDTNWMAP